MTQQAIVFLSLYMAFAVGGCVGFFWLLYRALR